MQDTLMKLRAVHSSSLIIILSNNSLRIYDEDVKIVEFISNLLSKNSVLVCKNKYLDDIKSMLKKRYINYVVLDKNDNYRVFDYYYNYKNKYDKYIKLSNKYNKFRRYIVYFYNFIFDIPLNRFM